MNSIGITQIERTFQKLYDEESFVGAQLVVHHEGTAIVNQAVGWADKKNNIPVTLNTPFIAFSISKIYTYLCIYKLIEEGMLEWDKPIFHYWPEFGQHGKNTITIRQLLLHRAGLPGEKRFIQIPLSIKWKWITDYMARQKPEHPPGSQVAYHLVNSGFILGELVRRVTKLSIRDYLYQTFIAPMQFENTYLGIPAEKLESSAQLYTGKGGYKSAKVLFNQAFIRKALIPAASIHSSAQEVAQLFQMLLNNGQLHNHQFISPEMISTVTTMQYDGYDSTLKRKTRWSYGFQIGGAYLEGERMGYGSSVNTYGHFGLDTCMVWADSVARFVVVFLCNTIVSNEHSCRRLKAISDSVWQVL